MSRQGVSNVRRSTAGETRRPTAGKKHDVAAKQSATEEIIQTSFRMPRSRWKKLQELAIDQRVSVQSIILVALEGEFAKRGLKF